MADVYIGFDSAWADNPKLPGAICAIRLNVTGAFEFTPPQLVSFSQALAFIRRLHSREGNTLIALDQPTIVPNLSSMRPAERVAASLISWLGGGVQPANRGRVGMFCDASPIWRFLADLGAKDDPELARTATTGLYVMEVFPALALASLNSDFFTRLGGPRYNPSRRKTFSIEAWRSVIRTAAKEAQQYDCQKLNEWCVTAENIASPKKADQDQLDAVLCMLIALHWRLRPRGDSLLLGDLTTGYMVLPASRLVRERLQGPARSLSVAIDGIVQTSQTTKVSQKRAYPTAPLVGIGVVLLRGDDVLLVKRDKPPALGAWSLPGGAQELGETAEQGARRELLEETGITAGALTLIAHVDSIHCDAEGRIEYHYTILDFGGVYTGGDAVAGGDVSEVAWVRLDDFDRYDLWSEARGVINKTVSALRR